MYCPVPGLTSPHGNCSARYYCTFNATSSAPTDGVTGNKCPVGFYCPVGSGNPVPCPDGTFSDTELNEECLPCTPGHYCVNGNSPPVDCPSGFYCPEGTGVVWQSCPAGTFSANVGLANVTQCTACSGGFYCGQPNLTTVSGPCDAGYYCRSGSDDAQPSGITAGDAGVCPEGHYCVQQTQEPEPCPTGTFNNRTMLIAEAECQTCLPGYYCDIPGLIYPAGPCEPGYYCTEGSNSSNPSVTNAQGGPCPQGSFCPEKSSLPQPCSPGTYAPTTQMANCTVCPPGFYCESGSSITVECPKGHYCEEGTEFSTQYQCPNGTFNNVTASTSSAACQLCTPGYYCDRPGLELPTGLCSGGFFCSLGSWSSKPSTLGNITSGLCDCPAQSTGGQCKTGSFCPEGSSAPIPCTGGYYCGSDGLSNETGQCYAGYYCSGNATIPNPVNETFGDACPSGHYCPEGSSAPHPCGPGTYSSLFYNHNVSSCLSCTAGSYCSGTGLSQPVDLCDEGWFCPEGQTVPQPPGNECLAGHKCPQGSPDQEPCSSGYYQPLAGQGQCIECPSGMYCDQTEAIAELQSGGGAPSHGVVTPKVCPAGYFCPNSTETDRQYPCPLGTFGNVTGLESSSQCVDCLPGYYCQAEGITEPSGLCNAGYYCVINQTSPSPAANSQGGPCPQGTYCVEGSSMYEFCPKGTYGASSMLTALSDCTFCPPGEFCDQPGLIAPNGSCLAGYYCSNGSEEANPVGKSYGDECPPGYYCPDHSYQPTACPQGTYQPFSQRVSLNDCSQCDPGFYCNATGTTAVAGPCEEGFYCTGGANSSSPTDGITGDICPAGSYCPQQSTQHYYCPNGTYANHTGAAQCYDCPEGYYCVNRDRADSCLPGYYCPARTGADLQACPAGTYNPVSGLAREDQCTECDGGKFCGNPHLDAVSGNCNSGYYCRYGVNTATPSGNHTGNGGVCPIGAYCPTGTTEPLPCPAGEYSDSPGQTTCTLCPAGFYCLENSTDYSHQICPSGHYCPQGTNSPYENPCLKGSYNPVNGSQDENDCLPCPAGQYCETDGLSTPSGNCNGGWYCTSGAWLSKPTFSDNTTANLSECSCPLANYTGGQCWQGTYCPGGTNYPVPCTPGQYCSLFGLHEPEGPCNAGYYCPGADVQPNPPSTRCPDGHYCPQGSATAIPCPAGTFSNSPGNTNVSNCDYCTPGYYCAGVGNTNFTGPCLAGFYCPAGQQSASPAEYNCTLGHYCPEASGQPITCEPGFYQDQEGQSLCKDCPAGSYCDPVEVASLSGIPGDGVTIPADCPEGYFCLANTGAKTTHPCSAGTFSNNTQLQAQAECRMCTGGQFCDSNGLTAPVDLCDAGFVCVSGSNSSRPTDGNTGFECLPGYYCPKGSDQGIKCPAGTFSDSFGLENVTECQQCLPGTYCNVDGLTAPAGNCTAGHFCTLGSDNQSPIGQMYGDYCPSGYYCPEGTGSPIPCPSGTYQPDTARSSLLHCLDCPGGKYCEASGQSNYTGDCTQGFYCHSASNSSTPTDGITGDICPAGTFCPTGTSSPLPCADGTYMNHTQASVCESCPPRYYCVNKDRVDPCPLGRYCQGDTGFNVSLCPAGTYGQVEMLAEESECTQCDGGKYCDSPGLYAVSGPCNAGYYCSSGVDTATPNGAHTGTGGDCPVGHYCPEGTADPIGCAAGTYNDLTNQDACRTCEAGYYCLANSTTYLSTPCPTGAYCPAGTEFAHQNDCPAGTYNNRTLGSSMFDCLPCTGGQYCGIAGLAEPSGPCSAGWYCESGAYSEKPSPWINTTLSNGFNATCPIYSLNNTGGVCEPGTYCPEGSSQALPCPLGQFCENYALALPSGNCYQGYFCNGSAFAPDPQLCSKGHYCPEGTSVEVPCSPGTFSDREGNANITGCDPCTPGYYCLEYGLSTPTGQCDAGFFCPEGQSVPRPTDLPCSPGHFCLVGSHNQTGCPSGTYQPHWQQSDCDVCPAGFYCKAFGDYQSLDAANITNGNVSYRGVSVPTTCPAGSYCPEGSEFETHYLCPAGSYSNATGLSNATQCTPCDPGMYCLGQGNTSPTGPCSAGHFCTSGAYSSTPSDGITGDICPAGQFCPEGSITGQGCLVGTFSTRTGLTNSSECELCTPGHYCGITGLTVVSNTCWGGFYCSLGSEERAPISQPFGDICPAGSYCPNGTAVPAPCPSGTYLDTIGAADISDCIKCSPGFYCESTGQTNYTAPCADGYYCSLGANTSTPTDGVTGNICPEGFYCSNGADSPVPCPNATYVNHTGASYCYTCPAGSYCVNRDRADDCIQGYYCPEGTGADLQPCPLGTFGNTTGLSEVGHCTQCTGGYYCGTPGSPDVDGPCQAGYYCESGVDTATPTDSSVHTGIGGECPVGSYCPRGSPVPIICPAGSYTGIKSKSSCDSCVAGFYCVTNTSDYSATPCDPGFYCPTGTQHAAEYPCPAGTYNPAGGQSAISSCLDCPPGEYCGTSGLSAPTGNCSAGWFCTGGAYQAMPTVMGNYSSIDVCTCPELNTTGGKCQPGDYCPEGSDAPIKCTAGLYCDDYGLEAPKGECNPGYYCPAGQSEPNPSPFLCTPGHYCPSGSATPTPCPAGTFSNSSGNTNVTHCIDCTPGFYCGADGLTEESGQCDAGFYCPAGQTSPSPPSYGCPQGFYCPVGSDQPIMCERGKYQDLTQQATCADCLKEFYCDPYELGNVTGIITPVTCPAGYYCPLGTGDKFTNPCPLGTYSGNTGLEDSSECTSCDLGKFCGSLGLTTPEGDCDAGYYCSFGASSPTPTDGVTGNLCPEGRYCPQGSFVGQFCPVGTFNNMTGLRAANDCLPCDPGFYCPTDGLLESYAECSAGHYCELGSEEPSPVGQVYGYRCPVGHYCPQGTPAPVPCPAGTYQPAEGKQANSACVPCDDGYYCLHEGNSSVTGQCSAGYYCIQGASIATPTDGVTGDICPAGNYCPMGSSSPTPCSIGTYLNYTGGAVCDICPAGYFCIDGAQAEPCPQGNYCPEGTGANAQLCPKGSYGASDRLLNETQCTACTGGYYCPSPGLTAPPTQCNGGYYCISGVDVANPNSGVSHTGEGDICPAGHQCPVGSSSPSPCLAGEYSPSTALAQCSICPEGYYCVNGTITPAECPTGHYCPAGTEFDFQYACPPGTYNNVTGATNETSCLDCPPGEYCEGHGNVVPSGLCDPGFFCAGRASQSRPYDPGYLTTANGNLTDLYSNDTCTPMWDCVCPSFLMTSGGLCPIGHYCPQGSAKPTACDPGLYCETPGLSSPTGNCSAGFYCNSTSGQPDQIICPAGYYCEDGTGIPEPCPAGTFSSSSQGQALIHCLNCTAGYYCQGVANTGPTDQCSPGYYCPGGQKTPTPSEYLCWQGHFCEQGSTTPTACLNGTYQLNQGQSACIDCSPGYYCDPFEANVTIPNAGPVVNPSPCPVGYYCPAKTSAKQSFPCPAGTFGPDEYYSDISNCTQCTAGSYCERDGLSAPTGECWAGYYCTGGASSPTPIFDNVNTTDNSTFTGNDRCPVGYYCTNGTTYPIPCPRGTFSIVREVTSPDGCEPCPQGRYCDIQAFTKVDEAPLCSPGYICTGGSTTPTPNDNIEGYICPAGHFCVAGALVEEGCPIGTFQPSQGMDNCTVCPAGYMCPNVNMTMSEDCQSGYYCPEGELLPCPAGTYNNKTGMSLVSHCTDCSPGKFCEGVGNSFPNGDCDAGYFCEGGSDSRAPSSHVVYTQNGECIVGHYCPEGTTLMIPCPAGTIRNSTGGRAESDCLPCPGGYYCDQDGQVAAAGLCSQGYYCPANATVISPTPSSYLCPVGYYCPTGSPDPVPCPAGLFQISSGQWTCDSCPAGSYCPSAIPPELIDCPSHNYCPNGTVNPIPCDDGTFTYDNMTRLQAQSDCLPCEAGMFCRNGQLYGNCSAGYYCKSGSSENMPNSTFDFDVCVSDEVCAGFCPTGSYCPTGTLLPVPCPENTYRDTVGAEQEVDCPSCLAGFLCPEGTSYPEPCPVGQYCLKGNGTAACPRLTFRNVTGAAVITDCFPCPAGYWCNYTGMADYSNNLCPPGYFCLEGDEPRLCPAGRMRDTPGASSPTDCPLCRPGYYCPNDTDNTQGIPCRETYECPTGASIEIDCRPGYFCNGTTGDPYICPGGYYCPNATDTPIICNYPYYCPEGSNMTLTCPLGYKADHPSGVRDSLDKSCSACPAGYYGNDTDRADCYVCPAGYYCPAMTHHGTDNPCPVGSYCPEGSAWYTPCPAGMYGTRAKAVDYGECQLCPADTYNDVEGQQACRKCGSSASAEAGSTMCSCRGKYRYYLPSDGSCLCLSGYIYYDEASQLTQDGDSDENCQQIVDSICSSTEVRWGSDRKCVNPNDVDCSIKCPDGGAVSVSLGMCECDTYTEYSEICNPTCQSTTQPTVQLELQSSGAVTVSITDPTTGTTTQFTKTDVIGPSEVTSGSNNVYVVNFFNTGVAGSVYADATSAQDLLYDLQTLTSSNVVVGRRRLLTTTIPSNQILNPALCLELGEIVLFNVWIDSTNRTGSNYPVYVKNHLYNTNPTFDYGAFTQLQNLIDNTNVSITSFAHAFTEAGTYVFADAQVPSWEFIVQVQPSGSSCSSSTARMMPASAFNLIGLGVYKQNVANTEPDWGIIVGLIAFFAALVLLLVVAVIVWRPHDSVIYPVKHWKPPYRKLGTPPPVPSYIRYDPDNWNEKYTINAGELGPRPGVEGAEVSDLYAGKGLKEDDLEEFNVRVLYDKLEDQNLHLASQLAKQKEDLDGFYNRICQQNEELKKLLQDMDPSKMAAIEAREAALEKDGLQGAAGAGGVAVAGVAGATDCKNKSASGSREIDLMLALQMLLDQLNAGNIPLSQEQWQKMQSGQAAGMGHSNTTTSTTHNIVNIGGSHPQLRGSQGEVLRRQNGERIQLEKDLAKEETNAMDNMLYDSDNKLKQITDSMAESLAIKLQGNLSDEEVKAILSQHEKDLQVALDKHNSARERQLADLRHKLEERRRKRERELREKHKEEAESVGLPPPVEGPDDVEQKLKTQQNVLTAVHSDEAAGLAKADMDIGHQLSGDLRNRMSSNLTDQIESFGSQDLLTAEQAQAILDKQRQTEGWLNDKFEKARQQQMQKLHDQLEKKRQQRMKALKEKQEKERAELSASLSQENREPEDKERMLRGLDFQHAREREALDAQLDAEGNELSRQTIQALDGDHTALLKEEHRKIKDELMAFCPQENQLAAQRILDQYRRDLEAAEQDIESQKSRQMADIQARLSAKRERKLREGAHALEEMAAQKSVSEQNQQIRSATSVYGSTTDKDIHGLHHMPAVAYGVSTEEQALKKEQERALEDLKRRHQNERDQLASNLDAEAQQQEQEAARSLDSQMEQTVRERRNKHAAEQAARPDLSQEELAELMAAHAQNEEELAERLELEKTRRQAALRDRLAEQRRRRMEELRRRQDAEIMSEMLDQRKEVDGIRVAQAKEVEHKAMEEGIKENGEEDSDKVVEAVLAQRHAQELADLENQFTARKKVAVDDALGRLSQKYDTLRDQMAQRHAQELAALEKQKLSPEEKHEKRAELLNHQHMEQARLERHLADEEGDIEKGALKEWEVEFARAKLTLKEKHYKEFAEALRDFSPDHPSIRNAEESSRELEKVREELDKRRRQKEEEMRREQDAFEKSEAKRLEAEMAAFAKELDIETKQETEKQERNIEALARRKEELIKENKKKLKDDLEKLKANGASKEEQDRLIKEHEKSTDIMVSRLEADRLRMQSNLQDKLKKRRQEKMKQHEEDVKENLAEQRAELESQHRNDKARMQTQEVVTLSETLNMDGLNKRIDAAPLLSAAPTSHQSETLQKSSGPAETIAPTAASQQDMPASFSMAAPLNEAELTALLMASPLYKKLEDMKKTVAGGNFKSAPSVTPGEGHLDERDATWENDTDLKPVDLNKLAARHFVVYKFGCYVADLMSRRCQHSPVTLLLAETVPSNTQKEELPRNMYRNSFTFDANNRILYIRAARLEPVGDFLLVLVHCLAHIKAGDLRDDTSPKFIKEYQRALSVMCDDLFFSKTKRQESPIEPPSKIEPKAAEQLLQSMFDNCPSDDCKMTVMEELLDVKLQPSTARDGTLLTKERLAKRLAKYSDFSSVGKLQGMLGDLEDKVHQAEGQGPARNLNEQMASLSRKFTSSALPSSAHEKDTSSFVMANMTGTALYQTFENTRESPVGQANDGLADDSMSKSVQEHQDSLDADFARNSQHLMQARDHCKELEENITTQLQLADSSKGKDQDQHKGSLALAQKELAKVKTDIQKLELEKERIIAKMAKLDPASGDAKVQKVTFEPTMPTSAKSRKSQKGKK